VSPLVPQQGVPPQKQTTYNGVAYEVQQLPGGAAALLFITATEVLAFPLDAQAREAIGRKLLAPSIVTPNGGSPS
jgi:hypothetical protein